MMFDGQTHLIEFVLYCIEALILARFYITQKAAIEQQWHEVYTGSWMIAVIPEEVYHVS
jgi:hypothetical protein